jgi:hypothetical protein
MRRVVSGRFAFVCVRVCVCKKLEVGSCSPSRVMTVTRAVQTEANKVHVPHASEER